MSLIKTPFDAKTQIQAEAKKAQSDKLRKLGAVGSLKRARTAISETRKYGGSGGKFAHGGTVSGAIEGGSSKPRGDRGHTRKGGEKGGTNITIAMMPHSGAPAGPPAGPAVPPVAMMPHPPVPPPGAGPGGPPVGPGGPPMGGPPPGLKAATGGAIKYARGGRIANLGAYAHGGKAKVSRGALKAFNKEEAKERKEFMATGKHEEDDDEYARGGKIRIKQASEKKDEDVKLPGTGRGGKNEEDGAEARFGRAEGGKVIHKGVTQEAVNKRMKSMHAGASSGVGLLNKNGGSGPTMRHGNFNLNREGNKKD